MIRLRWGGVIKLHIHTRLWCEGDETWLLVDPVLWVERACFLSRRGSYSVEGAWLSTSITLSLNVFRSDGDQVVRSVVAIFTLIPPSLSYGMHMKEKICLTGLFLEMNHGCITTNPNQSVLQCNGNFPVHFQPKRSRSRHQLGRLCLPFLGLSGSTVSPFSEAWWKCEFYILLWSSVEASGCNSQKTYRPTGESGTASSWQCQTPYSPNNPGENSRTTVRTSRTSALQPGLSP
jgi:hypothetical protein